jgi:GT2 family glycosyltransferase
MSLAICVATMKEGDRPGMVGTFLDAFVFNPDLYVRHNTPENNLGVVRSYQWIYERVPSDCDVLAYVHDDVEVYEPGWDERVLLEFNDPKVAIVGFGGALGHGSPTLYKTPYRVQDLARHWYRSNTRDAEVHGERFVGSGNAVFCDGFALCIRRSFLDRIGGWTQLIGKVDFIGYDMAICALARRYGYKIRVVGIDCRHYGGGTSVEVGVRQKEYDDAHAWFYDEFRDVMPAEVMP